jgi:Rrf2 family iron-sulfur cluster assembly transcriptional regulator
MRLEIMRRSDIALRAMRLLQGAAGPMRAAEIAEALGTTRAFLPQVLAPLVRAGWIDSDPGPRGGYRLAVDPSRVTLLELIEIEEGPTENHRCVLRGGPCPGEADCSLHDAWVSARHALMEQLARQPVAAPLTSKEKSS